METKSVKLIPKDRRSQLVETKSVKSIPKDFSEVKPDNGDKISKVDS